MLRFMNSSGASKLGSPSLPAGMAVLATCASVLFEVALDASCHGGDVGGRSENFHFADIAMAQFAFHVCFQMRSMVPEDPAGNDVYAHPRNALIVLREFRQLLNGGLFLGDGPVALHALVRRRQRHAVTGLGIGVTPQTFQVKRHVQLVAKGNGLSRDWSFRSGRGRVFRG